MSEKNKHIMVIAGETSGDIHAGQLVKSLQTLDASLTFSGLGGPAMSAQGVELFCDLTQLAVVGFIEVVKYYGRFRRIFYNFLKEVKKRKPAAVILVDYPGFNLRMARALTKMGVRVIYYISPQVWAWKESRVKLIAKNTDRLLVLFSFEETFFAEHGVNVTWTGHPLIDNVKPAKTRGEFLASLGLAEDKTYIGILPGSRNKEIERILPVMLGAASIIAKNLPNTHFLLPLAPNLSKAKIQQHLSFYPDLPVDVIPDQMYNLINATYTCIVASGTATLETGILEKPMVIVYKTSFLSYCLAKMFVTIPHIGLVNVVAQKKIVPEYVQNDATEKNISAEMIHILSDQERFNKMQSDLRKLRFLLGGPGASLRAARSVRELLP